MTQLIRGVAPLLISLPHVGTNIPEALQPLYQDRALGLEDTDWFLDSLYDFAQELGASLLTPQISRYVIDLNRPPDNTPMYPGASNTELCPTRFFSGEPLYKENCAPSPEQIVVRRTEFWEPYHRELQTELSRLKQLHPHVLLWDGHSIRSQIPWLFEGKLPDFNFGTYSTSRFNNSARSNFSAGTYRNKIFDRDFFFGNKRMNPSPLGSSHSLQNKIHRRIGTFNQKNIVLFSKNVIFLLKIWF
jgi:N-formylglutamate deformylase